MKKVIVGFVLIILIFAAIGGVFIYMYGPNLTNDSYRVKIQGTIFKSVAVEWGVTVGTFNVEPESLLHVGQGKPLIWPWSDDLLVKCEVEGLGKKEVKVGGVFPIDGKQQFALDYRWVEPGTYHGNVKVYELKDGGMFGGGSEVLQASCSFSFDVP